MSNRTTKNPASSFLKATGIKKENSLQTLLTKEYGEEAARKLKSTLDAIELKRDKNSADRTEFYDFVNSQKKFSHLLTCYQDADYLAQMCRWLNGNRGRFGSTVLDVGCGNGILTCFLAQLLPDATFLGIDRSVNAITMAKDFRDSLGLTNVVFMRADVADVSGRTFDTVLALRTLTENYLFVEEPFLSFGKCLQKYCLGIRPYMETLSRLVSPKGHLILAEPDYRQLTTLGILNEMNHIRLGADPKEISQITCRIGDEKEYTNFRIFIGTKGCIISNQKIFESWEQDTLIRESDGTYTGIGARYLCWEMADSIMKEVRIICPETQKQSGLFALFRVKGSEDRFLLYQENEMNASLGIFPNSRQEEAVSFLKEQVDSYRKQGYLAFS